MAQPHVAQLKHESNRGLLVAARIGYAAKGLVYTVMGTLALLAAFGDEDGQLTGGKGAINALAEQPFGGALLWVTAVGLGCYALWSVVRAARDPEREMHSKHPGLARAGYALAALSHGALAYYAGKLAYGSGGRSGDGTKSLVARVLELPLGSAMVALAGVIAIAFGVHQMQRAVKNRLETPLATREMSPATRRVTGKVGRFGTFARGAVFPIIGGSLLVAAFRRDPGQAGGVGDALRELATKPFGELLLAIIAAGFVAYGIYQFFVARYAEFPRSVLR